MSVALLSSAAGVADAPSETPSAPLDLPPDEQASLIFHNGVLLTMDGGQAASAIAVKDERIVVIGSDEDVLAHAGPGTVLIDLAGRTLMPGFVDAHGHVLTSQADDLPGAQEMILSKGVTTYAEMSARERVLQSIVGLDRAGELRLRVSLYPGHVDNCGNLLGSWYAADYPVSREPGAMLQIPGVKIFNDGGSCNAPAVSYENPDGGRGDLYFTVEELTAIIEEVQANGYQAAIHALGDRAIEVNMDAIEAAIAGGANTLRHRIEHNTLLRDDMLTRYTEIDIVPLIFGALPTCWYLGENSRYAGSVPDEYRVWEWRWRDLVDSNPDHPIAWHNDSPPIGPEDPFLHLFGFVTRRQRREDGTFCEPPDWAADDLLTVEEALPIMTIGAAYALHREDEIGSLQAGKLADLIILSANPLDIDHEAILDIQVLMTMVGGQVAHCAPGHEALCP